MCFDLDSRPPITPIAGGALDSERLVLTADDGVRFLAFRARAATPTGAAILILPDVRGLHPFFEELALRFAESGVDAIAIDYFGRTAGTDTARDESFDYMPHVKQTTRDGLGADIRAGAADIRACAADIRAGAADLRSPDRGSVRSLFTIGFCFGGRLAFMTAAMGLDLAGTIGFYGRPTARNPTDAPVPIDVVGSMQGSVLGLFGGADSSIPAESIDEFDVALTGAGVDHRLVTYPGAPHSFFDRNAAEYAEASAAAWGETLRFVRDRTTAAA
jgi:carboxymethylenebutenolidase